MKTLNKNIKEIHIYTDLTDTLQISDSDLEGMHTDYKSSMDILYGDTDDIYLQTTDISILGIAFFLIENGIRVFLHHGGRKTEIKEHMPLPNSLKDIRKGHNILKLFLAGLFD